MDQKTNSDILKIDEAAQYLGVTRRWVYRRIWAGALPASKVGGFYFIRRADLEMLIDQGRLEPGGGEATPLEAAGLKCGYCLRLLDSDAEIGEVCAAEGCEELICSTCLKDDVHHCVRHIPNREALWEAALVEHRAGRLPLLVKASQARLREVDFLQRLQQRLGDIQTLRHPKSDETLTVPDWSALLEAGDERAAIMRLMNKAVLETEWLSALPLNAHARYLIPLGRKQKGAAVAVLAQAISHNQEMVQKGFDTQPMNADDLARLLLRLGEEAQSSQTVTLVMLGATTGWDESARALVQGGAVGGAFSHAWMLVYLNDLQKHEIIYNRKDTHLRDYADLFSPLLPDEEAAEVAAAVEQEMGAADSFTLLQAVEVLPYTRRSLERAFEKMAATGRFALMEVDGIGKAIIRV